MSRWGSITDPSVDDMRAAIKDLTWKPQYLVYRDSDGDFASNGLIKPNPEYETTDTEALPSRKLQSLRKKDKTIDIVSDGFSFTRKITSGGPYYITPDKVWSLRDKSMSSLINEIEGQSADSSRNLIKWPEYFNFLIAPLNADMVMCKGTNNAAITPNFHTEVHVKTTATWLCMSNAKVSSTIGFKSDPYYKANADYNMSVIQHSNTHRIA